MRTFIFMLMLSAITPAIAQALSPAEMADLRAGRGMGFAKPAELNAYPGPMHVLELADALSLSADQRTASAAIERDMRAAAMALGEKIVDAERDLDRAFAEGRIELMELQQRARDIGALWGELRAVHLSAHLRQRARLTAEQTQRYMVLRGYTPMQHHNHTPKQ